MSPCRQLVDERNKATQPVTWRSGGVASRRTAALLRQRQPAYE
jgi:hypothetical protein